MIRRVKGPLAWALAVVIAFGTGMAWGGYPGSIATFPTRNTGDIVQPADVNGPSTEVTAIETGLLSGFQHSLKPFTNNAYDLGAAALPWRNIYASNALNFVEAGGTLTISPSNPAANRTITLADPGGADTIAYLSATQTLSGKTLNSPSFAASSLTLQQTTANYTLSWANPAAARTLTIPDPGASDTFAFLAAAQTLTGKTLASPTITGTVAGGAAYTSSPQLGTASLATTATTGFPYISTFNGVPTGTPTTITGMEPLGIDDTDHRLYFYSGGWFPAGIAALVRYRVNLGADITLVANTTTAVVSQNVIFPSSGGPFRVWILYAGQAVPATGIGQTALWVTDGTNNFAEGGVSSATATQAPDVGWAGGGISPVTYANGANITFTLNINSPFADVVKAAVAGGTGTPALNTHMDILVIPMN